jgi:hypothetical protein
MFPYLSLCVRMKFQAAAENYVMRGCMIIDRDLVSVDLILLVEELFPETKVEVIKMMNAIIYPEEISEQQLQLRPSP